MLSGPDLLPPPTVPRPEHTPASRLPASTRERLHALRHLLLLFALVNVLFNLPVRVLHSSRLMLAEYNVQAPYHYDPRFADRRHRLANDHGPLDLVFTGDSRAEGGLDPDLIDAVPSFNLATGAQTIPLTEHIVLDTLAKLDKHPRYLLIGITPDYLSSAAMTDSGTELQMKMYDKADTFPRSGLDRRIVERLFPALFYRDTVMRDLKRLKPWFTQSAPPPKVWGYFDMTHPLTWGEYFRLHEIPMTARGFNVDLLGPHVAGDYPAWQTSRPRLKPPYTADRAALRNLVARIREQRIEPLFLIMPFHKTFYQPPYHPESVRIEMDNAVHQVAADEDVRVLPAVVDTSDPKNYYDGHHLSVQGARALSLGVNAALHQLRASGELDRRYERRFGGDRIASGR
jgi:hypothetical protein